MSAKRYVQRDEKTGEVIAHFANEQPYAKELLDEDHPHIRAFKECMEKLRNPNAAVRIEGTMRRSAYARGLTRVLAARFGITPEQLLAEIAREGELSCPVERDAAADIEGDAPGDKVA